MADILKIGNASGFWGDDPDGLRRQVQGGRLDYITMDFLAEVTMSIMQKQRSRDPSQGYARDFITMLEGVLPTLLSNKTRLITNAGGINPPACAAAIDQLGRKLKLNPRIGMVYGDDILEKLPELRRAGAKLANMETGDDFAGIADKVEAANVYFGARPVVKALEMQPDIMVTGRVTDTGITLAPMIHKFGWQFTDWDKLAAGIVAGHILECGTQVTGGNFTDWHLVQNPHLLGFPIVEMNPDGSFIVTKHEGSGGLVSVDTVREQLVYEMGHPRAYITPDVIADFSTIRLEQAGKDRVRVFGIKGYEPTDSYKISIAYREGYKIIGSLAISGPEAGKKAARFSELFWRRMEGRKFADRLSEFAGLSACHRSFGQFEDSNEVILRVGARASEEGPLKSFAKMIPGLLLAGPPGVTVTGGNPKPQEIVGYWPALMRKTLIHPTCATFADGEIKNETVVTDTVMGNFTVDRLLVEGQVATAPSQSVAKVRAETHNQKFAPLSTIALARSGDKGDTANIGVLARSPEAFKFLEEYLTAQRVKDIFQEHCLGKVTRYKLDNLLGFNFLLEESLGGGGTLTLKLDAQGKTFAQGLLAQRAPIPKDLS